MRYVPQRFLNVAIAEALAFAPDALVTTGDGKAYVLIPTELDGWKLCKVAAFVVVVSSSGLPTVQLRNVTQAVDMLTTAITIDVSEFDSYGALTPPAIDTTRNIVRAGNQVAVDVDVAGTGTKGLGAALVFEAPA